jgi:5-formyltetrahydrofolate cyclo-ligase
VITKADARKRGKEFRKHLDPEFVLHASTIISDRLQRAIDWNAIQSVNVYQQIHAQNEVETDRFVRWLEEQHPVISIHRQSTQPIFPNDTFDVVIVPCLAIDKRGARIGYGGGSYDRYLADHRASTIIALCYEGQVLEQIETEAFDIRPNIIVTEEKIRDLRD